MKPGNVLFFKTAKEGSHRKAREFNFKGTGFGVFLGHVQPFGKDPSPEVLVNLMGSIGWVTFDDVAELLGTEQGKLLLEKYEDKYYGKKHEGPVQIEKAASGLVNAEGAPLVEESSIE